MKLEVRGISFGYTRKKTVLSDISLALAPEELTVLAGVNGCGKSTLLKIMAGVLTPQCGNVYLNDTRLTAIPPRNRAKMLAFMGQSPEIPAGGSANNRTKPDGNGGTAFQMHSDRRPDMPVSTHCPKVLSA